MRYILDEHTCYLACAIHHLKAVIEEMVVSEYPHCLFHKLSPRDFRNLLLFFVHNF